MPYSIETTALTKVYHKKAVVDRLDLRVESGSFYGFLGPNGAGKSTTIKMLTGLIAPDGGEARLLGLRLDRKPLDIKRRIGVVPEDLCLFENLTAMEYLVFVARMYRMPRNTAYRRAEELLDWLGLDENPKALTLEFSHGMKKKLSLAAAVIHDPELIFLDEPFEGIDAIAARTIRTALARMVQRGATIFLTSHILEIVEKLCTHVGIIHQGRLVTQGTLAEVSGGAGLEEVFVSAVGRTEDTAAGLSWLGGAGA
ncbi:MAG: ATP-binding cassette domain-containing protein [Candidatus Hydrogenedens sp.]|nr:ATP-binding cassette domain-containing protein [Candidatus Hydrogenedens sp.]